jgi:hypothetical protein
MVIRSFSDGVTVYHIGSARVFQLIVINDWDISYSLLFVDGGPRGHCVKDHAIFYISFSDIEMAIIIVISSYL